MSAVEARRRLADDLRALGVHPGGVLLAHSSLSSLGYVSGGCETVVAGLLEALGEEGTLLMPALSYEHVTPARPRFDRRRTPSNVGAIAEHFRTRPGTRRSLHPTHSVSGVGPRIAALLRDHHADHTPCGPNSPFRRLAAEGGQLLFLGCGLRPNTSMHGVEELVEPPYLFAGTVVFQLVDENGVQSAMECRCHGFQGWAQRYDRIADILGPPSLCGGPVLGGQAHLLDARALWEAAEIALRRDPLCFVEPRS